MKRRSLLIGHEEGDMENSRNSVNMKTNLRTKKHGNMGIREHVNQATREHKN